MSPVTALLAGAAPAVAMASQRRPSRATPTGYSPVSTGGGGGCALAVECSSRPQKKATKHHMKTRPKKSQPWDRRRRPTQYPPLPPLPPDWTLVAAGATVDASAQEAEEEEAETVAAPAVEVVAAAAVAPAAAD
uniref:50S ribosomal protein 6, chloroplastic n=1 Tax=Leersia perrieri TaxID=77586 RepID=A0A0D9XT08_9ORYZ